jgi:hypothetical protein
MDPDLIEKWQIIENEYLKIFGDFGKDGLGDPRNEPIIPHPGGLGERQYKMLENAIHTGVPVDFRSDEWFGYEKDYVKKGIIY